VCEKPLAPSAAEADALMARARARGTFLAESMWTRAFPAARALRAALEAGAIGDVVAVQADVGFAPRADDARMWDPRCGGMGLDMGVYGRSVAVMWRARWLQKKRGPRTPR